MQKNPEMKRNWCNIELMIWINSLLKRRPSLSVATNSAFIFIDSLLLAGLGVIFWGIAARYYSLASIGIASALISSANLITIISNFGFSPLLIRYLNISGEREQQFSIMATLFPAGLALIIAIIFFNIPIGNKLINVDAYGIFVRIIPIILTVVVTISTLQDAIFIARHQGILVLITDMGGMVIRFVFLIILVNYKFLGLVSTITIGIIFSILFGINAWLQRNNHFQSTLPQIREMAGYGTSTYISGLLTQAPQLVFPILIASQISFTAAGAFNFAWLVASLLMTLPSSVANLLLARIVTHPEKASTVVRQVIVGTVVIVFILAVMLYFAAGIITPYILVDGANIMIADLPILLACTILFAILRLHYMLLAWRNKLQRLLTLNIIVGLASIIFPPILIIRWGVIGLETGWFLSLLIGVIIICICQIFSKKGYYLG